MFVRAPEYLSFEIPSPKRKRMAHSPLPHARRHKRGVRAIATSVGRWGKAYAGPLRLRTKEEEPTASARVIRRNRGDM
jgi:hypothetical protein